jgi:integrase
MLLANGNKCSSIIIVPKNWQNPKANVKNKWFAWYRFYDDKQRDKYPKGKLVRLYGVNKYHTAQERRDAIAIIVQKELYYLTKCAYNPITGFLTEPVQEHFEIDPHTPFLDALRVATQKAVVVPATRADMNSTIRVITPAVEDLMYCFLPIKEIQRRHIKAILDWCELNHKTFTAASYNRHRKNISAMYKVLVEYEAAEANIIRDISVRKTTIKEKTMLTEQERRSIDEHLKSKHYSFWRFVNIFFHSGARTPELLNVRKEDVDLAGMSVKYLIRKGRNNREERRPIVNDSLPLWKEVCDMALRGQYLFSEGLQPGNNRIRDEQIRRRWANNVQKPLEIKATYYSLKHLHTDMLAEAVGIEMAAKINGHSVAVAKKHYALGERNRQFDIVRNISISLNPGEETK